MSVKNNKNSKSVSSFFLPMAKYSQDSRTHKIKRITTAKRIMTRNIVLACTTIFSALQFHGKLVITYYKNFFLQYVTLIHTVYLVKIYGSDFNKSFYLS